MYSSQQSPAPTHCESTHLYQAAAWPVHHCVQLANSCKSTALFLCHFLHIQPAIHCTVTVPKVIACCCCLNPSPHYPSEPPHPLICNLSDLVQAEIARNPVDLHRPQGSQSIGPHSVHRKHCRHAPKHMCMHVCAQRFTKADSVCCGGFFYLVFFVCFFNNLHKKKFNSSLNQHDLPRDGL